ncbi:MAG: hypothetical protein A4E60_00231 [Syntrophorhabdus sp. PtaB.Bin047]|jgi:hypothetical protein|nr:MAG: hypothetical protein A4E60_00231 [Syntrophorhabdus sp. PtaB.Bin047]
MAAFMTGFVCAAIFGAAGFIVGWFARKNSKVTSERTDKIIDAVKG